MSFMEKKMNVLNVQMDDFSAKDAMKAMMEYMQTETVNTVEIVSADILMRAAQTKGLKENIEKLDLVLAGDESILEAAGVTEKKKLQEARSRVFVKMALRYFHKSRLKMFVLADSEEETANLRQYLAQEYGGIEIVGSEVVPADESADDMITNRINGAEADVVLASLGSPKQEAFIDRCRNVLSVRLWFGIGRETALFPKKTNWTERVRDFFERKILKREIEREKKKDQNEDRKNGENN